MASSQSVRSAHVELLRRYNKSGPTPDFRRDAATFIESSRTAGLYLEDEHERMDVQQMLDHWSTVLFRAGEEPPDATLEEFSLSALPELSEESRPYVGLDPFQEGEASRFFGREAMVGNVVRCLQDNRVVLVVGPSGSGRSSLVEGGVLPSLKNGALSGSETWRYLPVVVPGSDPVLALARLAVSLPGEDESADSLRIRLLEKPSLVSELLTDPEQRPALLVVDQVEELFTLTDDLRARAACVGALLAVAAAEHRILLILRSEFEPQFTSLWTSSGGTFARVAVVPPAARDLREVIEKPAAAVGLRFEDGLVDAILRDLEGEPLPLPLLQFTLMKLWEHRERDRVTYDTYRRLGGVRRILPQSAEAFFQDLNPELQDVLKLVLLRLVQIGDGSDVSTSRQRITALHRLPAPRERIDEVLDRLVASRLLRRVKGESPDADRVELAHEILARTWPRLAEWIEAERPGLTTRRRFDHLVREWQRLGSGTEGLLDARQLTDAEYWMSTEGQRLGYDEALPSLIEASRSFLEKNRLTSARFRRAVAVFVLVAVAAVGVFLFLDRQREAAKDLVAGAYAAAADSPDAALEQFEDARERYPANADVLQGLARSYARLGRDDDAIRTYEQLLAIREAAEDRIGLGNVFLQRGNIAQAREQFVRADALDPGSFDTRLHLGIASYYEGDVAAAEETFKSLHDSFPERPEAHFWSAGVHYWKGELDLAIEEYTDAVRLGARDVQTHLGLANTYYAKEEYELARNEYNRAIALAPNDVEPRRGLAMTYYAQTQFTQAVAEFDRALETVDTSRPETSPLRSLLYNGLGYSYLKMNNLAQAEKGFELAKTVNDGDGLAWLNLGIVHALQGRREMAQASWRSGVDRLTGTDSYSRLVRAFYQYMLDEPGAAEELTGILGEPTTTVPSLREMLSDAELLARADVDRARVETLRKRLEEAVSAKTTARRGAT